MVLEGLQGLSLVLLYLTAFCASCIGRTNHFISLSSLTPAAKYLISHELSYLKTSTAFVDKKGKDNHLQSCQIYKSMLGMFSKGGSSSAP